MLHLLLGRDWTANREEIFRRIAGDVRQKKGNRILMVPELISHYTERRLCAAAGDTASRFAEVLSFTRLARRVQDAVGSGAEECLDGGGRVVAMAAAARQLSGKLKAYGALETKPEFLEDLIDAVDEFKRCCISSRDLLAAAGETEGSLAQKLEELALLMEGYDALCSRGKRDPRDQMTWLLEQMEQSDFARDHVFYIDGFPDFTRQHLAILEHLIGQSEEVTVSLNCDRPDSKAMAFEKPANTARELLACARRAGVEVKIEEIPGAPSPLQPVREKLFQGSISPGCASGALQTLRGEDPYQECMAAANRIRELVAQGCRYRDITVVCTDMGTFLPLANLIFHRFHIPLYQAGTEDILQKSVIATVLTALEAALTDLDQKNVLRYLRSALSPLSPDECDLVENYAIIWGIRGKRWTAKWGDHPDGLSAQWTDTAYERLEALNDLRQRAVEPLDRLRRGFREANSLKEQVLALYAFLEDIRLEERLSQLAQTLEETGDSRNAQILNQLWEILVSALEQLYDVLGETHWEGEHFARLLRLLLSQYDVGTIPPVLDAVQLGPVSAMRCHQQKHLILLGAEEGKLPAYGGSAGVLTDQERVALRKLGVPLTGGSLDGIQAEFSEIYGCFCGAMETVTVCYSGEQPSFVFRRLTELSGGERKIGDDLGFAGADPREGGLFLSRWQAEETAKNLGLEGPYRQAMESRAYALGKVEGENVRKLYGNTLVLSASQIDKQADCRLAYFLRYGLRANPRKEAKVDPAEFGTYVHAVLEDTVREVMEAGGFHQVSAQKTLDIAHRHSENYTKEHFAGLQSERMEYLFRRNLRELDMVVEELWQELSRAAFEPAGFEVSFGNGEMPAIPVPNRAMDAVIRGFIDRVDAWQSGGSRYFRVVDYKTGKKSFDYCDVFNGVGLQMLLYLFALEANPEGVLGGKAVAAGVQYFPARVPYISADGLLTPEEAEKERQNHWKRRGLLLRDGDVLNAMEPEGKPGRSFTLNKEGQPQGELADREQLKKLKSYVFCILARLVEDISSGNVEPNPYTRGAEHDPCRFCDYSAVCHPETVAGRRIFKKMDAQWFWEAIEKELNDHGG